MCHLDCTRIELIRQPAPGTIAASRQRKRSSSERVERRLAGVLRDAGAAARPPRTAPPGRQRPLERRLHRARRALRGAAGPAARRRTQPASRGGEEPPPSPADPDVRPRPRRAPQRRDGRAVYVAITPEGRAARGGGTPTPPARPATCSSIASPCCRSTSSPTSPARSSTASTCPDVRRRRVQRPSHDRRSQSDSVLESTRTTTWSPRCCRVGSGPRTSASGPRASVMACGPCRPALRAWHGPSPPRCRWHELSTRDPVERDDRPSMLRAVPCATFRGRPAAIPGARAIFGLVTRMAPCVRSSTGRGSGTTTSTVEYHLRKVFLKLGVTSRTTLALVDPPADTAEDWGSRRFVALALRQTFASGANERHRGTIASPSPSHVAEPSRRGRQTHPGGADADSLDTTSKQT